MKRAVEPKERERGREEGERGGRERKREREREREGGREGGRLLKRDRLLQRQERPLNRGRSCRERTSQTTPDTRPRLTHAGDRMTSAM